MSPNFFARMAAYAALVNSFGPYLGWGSDPSPAYRPKRTKLKGYQKAKRRGRK